MNKCDGCRHWSQMVAQSIGAGPIEALCLNSKSPKHSKYMRADGTCPAWQHNRFGQIDDPPNYGEYVRPLYDHECKRCEGAGLVTSMPEGHEIECPDCEGAGYDEEAAAASLA